ncbi:MAG: sugar-binding domain-containing protein [Chloroflexota bacterium]
MENNHRQAENALQAAQMYYYQNLPMKKIAAELQVSPSTISRLLTWAREHGLVEIRINDLHGRASSLEERIKLHYRIQDVTVVPVSEMAGQEVWQDRVVRVAANYLNRVMKSDMILGLAWGETVNQIVTHLTPKLLVNAHVVQLNGGDAIPTVGIHSAVELVTRFANNYEAMPHLFYVPTFFDHPETKRALWRESSVQRVLERQKQVDVVLYSVGSAHGSRVSALYSGPHLTPEDYNEMQAHHVVGDIANVMIRENGRFEDIPLNQRACGPDLNIIRQASRAICVVSGHNKLTALQAALTGGYITDLILDEPTASRLLTAISYG